MASPVIMTGEADMANKPNVQVKPQSASMRLKPAQVERVLGSGALEGFTPGTASKLVAKFGSEAIEAVATWNMEAKTILGVRWDEASDEILEHSDAIPMISWLLDRGFSGLMARKTMIWQRHESDFTEPQMALDAWTQDPYLLAEIPGITFERADRIALTHGGIEPEARLRLVACAREALKVSCDNAGGGARLADAQYQAKKLLGLNGALPPRRVSEMAPLCLEAAQEEGWAKMAKDELGQPMIFSTDLYEAEEQAAHILLGMLDQPCPLKGEDIASRVGALEAKTGLTLHDEQREALSVIFKGRISIVCGKPGSGKTTLLKCAAPLIEEGGKKVLYAAPTGKAAKRMSQSLGRHASTLHRLLGVGKESKGGGKAGLAGKGGKAGLKSGTSNPMAMLSIREADAVVLDETSMLDSKMFLRLLKALGPKTALILVGDPKQLPSVGAGKVLQDLIDSNRIPTAIMNKIMRQSANSSINVVARAIGEGQWTDFRDKEKDCLFLDAPDAESIAARIAKMLLGAAKDKYDPLKDAQILCTGNQGPAGVHAINVQLQKMLNPPGLGKTEALIKEGLTLRVGDKVMQLTNDYERALVAPEAQAGLAKEKDAIEELVGSKKGVFNGDVGYVESVRVYPMPGKVTVRFDDGVAEYDLKEASSALTLAYACTVHKYQGSEAPLVFYIMHDSASAMLRNRNLVYTAITRAKTKCIVMGSERALRMAVEKDALAGRRTRLKGLLDGSISVDATASSAVLALSEKQAFTRLVEERAAQLRDEQREVDMGQGSDATSPQEPVKRRRSLAL
jgi:exodeoxyribonuclease V alpha subunit